MEQLYVSLENTLAEQLKEQANKRGIPASQLGRELIELGWRVQQAQKQSNGSLDETKLWHYALSWQMEDRLVTRYVLSQLQGEQEATQIIKQAKAKAENFVNGVLGYDDDTNLMD
jgi:transcription antitermination factor NusG